MPSSFPLPEYFPAVNLMRGNFVDQRFFALASLFSLAVNGSIVEKELFGKHKGYPFFLRSLLKPIQASIMADYNTINHFGFNELEIAIMQASHAGEKIHTDPVESILKKAGISPEMLVCPAIPPLCPGVLSPGEAPKPIHNNCSAKHAMMLAVSKQLSFPLENYTAVSHPVQNLIREKVIELSDFENPPQTLDGCTVPVYALPLNSIAKAFFKLYNDEKYSILMNSYKQNPYIIGGKDALGLRQDTFIMQKNPDLISKTGAGGFLSVYNVKTKELLLVKMAQDNNTARLIFAVEILNRMKWLNCTVDMGFYTEDGRPAGEYKVFWP